MDSNHPDAFSRTLESRPRSRHVQPSNQSTASPSFPHRDGSVNRLSRVFEHNPQPPHTACTANTTSRRLLDSQTSSLNGTPARPTLPTKPPSLRLSSSTYQHTHDSLLPSPSSESMPSPATSTATVATSVTSYTSDAQQRPSFSEEQAKNATQNEIDQTSLAFSDIRAKFQQQAQSTTPSIYNVNGRKNGYVSTSPPSTAPPPLLPKQGAAKRMSSIKNNQRPATGVTTTMPRTEEDDVTTPRSGCFVAELSKRLEQAEGGAGYPTSPPPPPKVTSTRYVKPRPGSLRNKPVIPAQPLPPTNNSTETRHPPPPPPPHYLSKRPSSSSVNNGIISTSISSPITNTSNTLHIPAIPRHETGNSTASTSSQSSSVATNNTESSPSRKPWHYGVALTSWLTGHDHSHQPSLKDSITIVSSHPASQDDRPPSDATSAYSTPSLPVSPQPSGKGSDRGKAKRSKVVQELVSTEKAYQKDMLLLKEVFYDRAQAPGSPLSRTDVKTLFSNLLDIIELEASFVEALEIATDNRDDESITIGAAFRQFMSSIDCIYCEYCKRHEDAVLRLQELEMNADTHAFLNDCQAQMQGKTTSWDLGSLLIKPVQRVLKYPLLLREIFLLTPAEYSDHDDLASATQEIQEVADHINEIKRRKDIVEKIVGDKKKTEINVVHGINKKLTRRAQRFKQATGFAAEATQDASFDMLHLRFEEQREIAQQLARDVQGWVRQVKNHFETLRIMAESLETLYSSWGGVRVKSMQRIRAFGEMTTAFSSTMTRVLDSKVQGIVYSRIDGFLTVFDNPSQVISKRAQKLLDYDRVRDIKSKGDTPDKSLQESADAYVSINAQLVDELPKFFKLTGEYFDVIIGELAAVQMSFYEEMTREWQKLLQKHFSTSGTDLSTDGIIAQYTASMQHVERLVLDITPLNKSVWNAIPGVIPNTPPSIGDERSSIRSMSTASYQDSYF